MLIAEALQVLPDPNHFASLGWVLVIIAGLCVIFNAILGFMDRFKEKPDPKETYLTIKDWKMAEESRRGDRETIIEALKEIKADLKESKAYQAEARKRIHNKLNAHDNALTAIAARAEMHGDLLTSNIIKRKVEEGNKD